MTTHSLSERFYDFLTTDDEGRICQAISETACTDVPRNFLLNALNGSATKLAEQLASPGLVLPWLLSALGAPAFLAGLLVPVRQAGSMLPQLAIAGQLRSFKKRKWFWVGAGLVQAVALLLMALLVFTLNNPLVTGLAVVIFLGIFSLASGVGSVSYKDVLAKTVPKGRRGVLLATRATVGGILALGAGLLLRTYVADANSLTPYLILLLIAAALWFSAALLFAAIDEEDGATEGGRNALTEAKAGLRLLQEVPGFGRFIMARALLLSVPLSIPFYALDAKALTGSTASSLGIFVIAISFAQVLSSPFWGRFADHSSRTVMMLGGGLAVGVGLSALLFGVLPSAWHSAYLYGVIFLLLGIAQSGVRLGRKTYLVDAAPADERPLYVAVSNTIIGAITLAGGALGLISSVFGLRILLAVFVALALAGVLLSWQLPEAEQMVK
jgi:MFS family permease